MPVGDICIFQPICNPFVDLETFLFIARNTKERTTVATSPKFRALYSVVILGSERHGIRFLLSMLLFLFLSNTREMYSWRQIL